MLIPWDLFQTPQEESAYYNRLNEKLGLPARPMPEAPEPLRKIEEALAGQGWPVTFSRFAYMLPRSIRDALTQPPAAVRVMFLRGVSLGVLEDSPAALAPDKIVQFLSARTGEA